ncbi:hypothetical protein RTBOTA2_004457 [Rhodotorula toruloides]|uniref:Uncharacterized protein n=2 Tax=Rhodotorula toruloides TaxID=5286 RepID=A0A2T0AI15_RHOTO|nr:hypothetical protein RTBOTA2_004457 [Rhodotorula toruloides]PRQ77655.1 hypothetical protein AAT19DRAFT_8723 [Rhodotorula toruloides]
MLVARTPPSPSPTPCFSRDFAGHANATPRRPDAPVRRPSVLRNASSGDILTHAVLRFDKKVANIPSPSSYDGKQAGSSSPQPPKRGLSLDKLPPPVTTSTATSPNEKVPSPPTRPLLNPLSNSPSPPPSSGSLLARRRSSRTTSRPDMIPLLTDLKLDDLPTPKLDELDDTIRPEVIGKSSHAQTPSTDVLSPTTVRRIEKDGAQVVETDFKPTRSFVPTPFPSARKDWLDEDDEDEDDEDGVKADVAETKPEAAFTDDGTKWLPLLEPVPVVPAP